MAVEVSSDHNSMEELEKANIQHVEVATSPVHSNTEEAKVTPKTWAVIFVSSRAIPFKRYS